MLQLKAMYHKLTCNRLHYLSCLFIAKLCEVVGIFSYKLHKTHQMALTSTVATYYLNTLLVVPSENHILHELGENGFEEIIRVNEIV